MINSKQQNMPTHTTTFNVKLHVHSGSYVAMDGIHRQDIQWITKQLLHHTSSRPTQTSGQRAHVHIVLMWPFSQTQFPHSFTANHLLIFDLPAFLQLLQHWAVVGVQQPQPEADGGHQGESRGGGRGDHC